ncbi:unnamed protein product, partial [Rotaria magnacalcarata]
IAALAFSEPSAVTNGFERLSMDLGNGYEYMIDYLEGTYIGRLR